MTAQSSVKRLRLDKGSAGFDEVLRLLLSSGERAAASGRKVVAKWAFMPVEPILAAGALPYDPHIMEALRHVILDEDTSVLKEAVESGLPPDFCPWNLAMAGSLMSGKSIVPIDLMIVSCGCWCDSMSSAWYSTSQRAGIPFHYFDVPRFDAETEEWATDYLVNELESLVAWLGGQIGKRIGRKALAEQVRSMNVVRRTMTELTGLLRENVVPIPALEYYLLQLTVSDCLQAPDVLNGAIQRIVRESKERVRKGTAFEAARDKVLRVFYSGAETQELAVFNAIEDFGGALVGCDTFSPLFRGPIPEGGSPIRNIAEWIWKTPYNFPTVERIRATLPAIKEQKAEAVIINNTTGCRYLGGSSRLARDLIRQELGLPVLTIETSLPGENAELTESRIRAFLETNR